MPKSPSFDVIHVATTDHRILRTPQESTPQPARAASGLPLTLLNGDEMGEENSHVLGRELAIALMSEVPDLTNTPRIRQRASSLLDQALARSPDDLAARRMRAQVLERSGHDADAMRLIESVLRSAPADEHALDQYLVYAIKSEAIPHALAPARQAVAVNPWSATFHERLAYVCLERHDWDEALRESREALRLNPFLRFARMFLIQCLLNDKDLEHAEGEFSALLKLNPNQHESLKLWFAEQRRNARS